jgi:hypothetical protein
METRSTPPPKGEAGYHSAPAHGGPPIQYRSSVDYSLLSFRYCSSHMMKPLAGLCCPANQDNVRPLGLERLTMLRPIICIACQRTSLAAYSSA